MVGFSDSLQKHKIFRDASMLSPHFVPKTLPFRDQQINEVKSILAPALQNRKPSNLFIYGKTGTGKTASVKYVMEKFNGENEKSTMHYVNCRIYNSRYRILQKVLKHFMPELEKVGFGMPFLYEKMIEISNKGTQLVIVLDEIDMVKDVDELVYTLTRVNDELKSGGITIIGISNNLAFKDALDRRSRSSLNETDMVFPPYTSEQLKKILEQRVDGAFNGNVVDQSAISLAAAITSQENGDARYALKLLLKAGEVAEQADRSRITDVEVDAARKNVELDLAQETIATLPENHQMLLYAIADLVLNGSKYSRLEGMEENFLLSGEVYDKYEHVCKRLRKRARSIRWYHEYLKELEMLGLIMTTPSSKGMRGHTTLIRLGHEAKIISEVTGKVLGL
jgi:cell division control protein 6